MFLQNTGNNLPDYMVSESRRQQNAEPSSDGNHFLLFSYTPSFLPLILVRMYKTLVRPVVTYACKTWVLKENIKSKLRVFERKVLRRIYGLSKEMAD